MHRISHMKLRMVAPFATAHAFCAFLKNETPHPPPPFFSFEQQMSVCYMAKVQSTALKIWQLVHLSIILSVRKSKNCIRKGVKFSKVHLKNSCRLICIFYLLFFFLVSIYCTEKDGDQYLYSQLSASEKTHKNAPKIA